MNKKIVTAGLVAGLLVGGGAGVAFALSGTDTSTTVAATETTVSGDDSVDDDRSGFLVDTLQPLVDDGTLTQAQLDAVVTALRDARPMGDGRGHHGGRHHGGRGGHGGLYGIDGSPLDIVADTIGLTKVEVAAAIQGGQTIADLAAANGSSGDAVITALVAEVEAHLAAEVEAGDHTQEEADARLELATAAITTFVNDTTAFDLGGRMHPDLDGDDNA